MYGITKALINYMKENCNIVDVKQEKEAISDALFYREVNYIIYIPESFRVDFLDNKNPKIEVKSTGVYESTLAEMMLERYIKIANIYNNKFDEEKMIENIDKTLGKNVDVEITSKLDANNIAKATFYYNFASYSILAGSVYVICLILSSFKSDEINKRTIISNMNYKKYNRELLISNRIIFDNIMDMLYLFKFCNIR